MKKLSRRDYDITRFIGQRLMEQINDWNSLPRENIRGYVFIHTRARRKGETIR